MHLRTKPNFEECKQYWRAFWQHEIIDRPCVCITAPKEDIVQQPEAPYLTGMDGQYEKAATMTRAWANSTYFGGEALPHFDPSFGPDQITAFVGAKLEMQTTPLLTSWVHPMVTDWRTTKLELAKDGPFTLDKMVNFIRYLTEQAGEDFLVGMLDLHSNMDMMSALRGPANLCMDLIDCPDDVEEAMKQVRSFYIPVYEALYNAGNMKERGCIGWAPTYCEEKFAVTQCDYMCMISKQHMRRYVLPALEEETSYLDHTVYHFDGKEALHHMDDILSLPGIDVIQWVPGDGNPRTIEWMDLLHKIQKAGKGLWIYDWTIDEIKQHHKDIRPEGVVFHLNVKSQMEAEDLLDYLKKNT